MFNEHSGKLDINITHYLSNVENLKIANISSFREDGMLANAVVEIRMESCSRRIQI